MKTLDDLILYDLRKKSLDFGERDSDGANGDAPAPAEKGNNRLTRKKITKKARKHRRREGGVTPTDDEVEEALSRLVDRGCAVKDGKYYSASSSTTADGKEISSLRGDDGGGDDDDDDVATSGGADAVATTDDAAAAYPVHVPIAEIIRRKQQQGNAISSNNEDSGRTNRGVQSGGDGASDTPVVDLEEEIRRLEAELEADDDDGDSDSENDSVGSSDGGEHPGRSVSFGGSSTRTFLVDNGDFEGGKNIVSDDPGASGVVCLSEVADDRIAPLPPSALPQSKRRILRSIDVDGAAPKKKAKKRRISEVDGERSDGPPVGVSEGLRSAVEEVLAGYVTSAALGKPAFYCRVCRNRFENEEDLKAHRQTERHRDAVKVEQKATYCRMCRKQMTSADQLTTHLKSRPHRDRLDAMRAKQGGGRGGGRGAGGRHSGRGGGDARCWR